ncbi:CBS domain-containing protein [Streptomyces tanashiensis]|uniref:CBS domain-containing protein n=2 Tax=Streptomyces tanashiensis TaxID=67367 RepID=A0ABY6R298_9ACTN|nr:CBS domain-containing protein [Streptomyces tanashiensis]UZX23079.1 CBS domain-containing protein [Streptomyces tanashiensis]
MQPRMPRPAPARAGTAAAADTSGPQVCDDMTVEVALAVMAGARAGHLIVCDNDDQRTGLVTRAQLTTVRDSPAYTDRLRLRDISGDGAPPTSATTSTTGRAVRPRAVVIPSGVRGQDDAPGTPARYPGSGLTAALGRT